jgi:hypothetical protein
MAIAVHLVAVLAIRRPSPQSAPKKEDGTPIELEIKSPTLPVEDAPRELSRTPLPEGTSTAARTRSAVASAARKETRESGAGTSEKAKGTVNAKGWTFDPRKPVDVTAPEVIREAAGRVRGDVVEHRAAGASQTGGLAEGLDAHDAAIGMGRSGHIVSALELATAGGEAPAEGNATFEVSVGSNGGVSVALLNASQAFEAWVKVGETLRASIDPKRVRVPPGARAWRVVATVEAKLQYPNGDNPKNMGTKVEGAAPELIENKHRTSVEDPPIVFKKMPGVTLAHAGKVCNVSITLGLVSGISGGCDPSNIGTHTLRVVSSHVVREGRL